MIQTKSKPKLQTLTLVKRAIIYARVSTDEQADSGTSLDIQVEKSLEYCEAHQSNTKTKVEIAGIFREEYTGTTLDRPKLNKIREIFRSGQADMLIVYKTNRLDRSEWGVNLLILLQELKMLGVELHYSQSKRQVNLDNPVEALMQSIEGWQAGEDRNEVVKRMVEGRIKRIKEGSVMVAGKPPYGYDVFKKGKHFKLVINESEARIVRLIFNWYTSRNNKITSIAAIQRQLNEMKIPMPSRGNRPQTSKRKENYWGRSAIYRILKNETYAGTWYYRKYGRPDGKLSQHDKRNWIPIDVPAIIDKELFKTTQERLKENRRKAGRAPKYQYLMSKRIYCACGYKCSCSTKNKITYYKCPGRWSKEMARNCNLPYFSGKKVDVVIWNWVKDFFEDKQFLRTGIEEYQKRQADAIDPLKQELIALNSLREETENELAQNQRALIALEGSNVERTKATILADIERLERTLDDLDVKANKLEAELEAITLSETDIQGIINRVELIKQETSEGLDLVNASFEDKRWLIERLNVEITLYVENGERMVEARCYLGEERLKLSNTTTI